jgi:adenylate cyclase, class 2
MGTLYIAWVSDRGIVTVLYGKMEVKHKGGESVREIEIKVSLTNLDEAKQKLAAAGIVLSEPKKQHDVVYCLPENLQSEGGDTSVNWLRVRTENDTTVYFTLKRSVSGSLDSIEHETVVEKGDELAKILDYMGYVVFSDLTKIRQTGHYGESIEICIDEVPPLGGFIELEKLCADDADGPAVEKELFAALETLGIEYVERMTKGYDELMNDYLAMSKEK